MANTGQYELDWTGEDPISCLQFGPGNSTRLAVGCWDKFVYVFDIADVEGGGGGQLVTKFQHQAAVLAVCWGDDDNTLFTGSLDQDVRQIDIEANSRRVLSTHDKAVKALAYSPERKLLISGSWDSTLKVHHPSNPASTPSTLKLPEKCYAISLSPSKAVVAMANRIIQLYDLAALSTLTSQSSQPPPNMIQLEPFQTRESSLKFMTRQVAAMPDDQGFATCSIEGRIAVELFDSSPEAQAKKYAFKCHRTPDPDHENGDLVWPVHALVFHPTQGTFASGGGEGTVSIWDSEKRRRTKQLGPYGTGMTGTAALDFSPDGKWLAIGLSPSVDFKDKTKLAEGEVKVLLRQVPDGGWRKSER